MSFKAITPRFQVLFWWKDGILNGDEHKKENDLTARSLLGGTVKILLLSEESLLRFKDAVFLCLLFHLIYNKVASADGGTQ